MLKKTIIKLGEEEDDKEVEGERAKEVLMSVQNTSTHCVLYDTRTYVHTSFEPLYVDCIFFI